MERSRASPSARQESLNGRTRENRSWFVNRYVLLAAIKAGITVVKLIKVIWELFNDS